MTGVAQQFLRAAPPPGNAALATTLGVPSQLTAQILQPLVEGGLLFEVAGEETAYTLARSPAKITCYDILLVLRTCAGQDVTTRDDPANAAVTDAFERIQRTLHCLRKVKARGGRVVKQNGIGHSSISLDVDANVKDHTTVRK